MRKLLTLVLLIIATFAIFISTAEAARFGGGRSFGMQRSASSFTRAQPMNRGYAQAAAPRNSWAAPLAGMALGGLMAYLFMGHGFVSGMLSWLLLISLGMLIFNLFRAKFQANMQTSRGGQYSGKGRVIDGASYFSQTENYASSAPAGFNADNFLRDAKVQFIRLQAAYDAKDLADLREFTAPEVFAEIQMQLQERGQAANHTEVLSLNADVLDVSNSVVTVKFSGAIREAANAPSSFFDEIWHFRQDELKSKWLVAGVQQNLN